MIITMSFQLRMKLKIEKLLKSIKESADTEQINKSKRNFANTEFKEKLVSNFLYLLFLNSY